MSWASNRETTRAEDRAYCLLGIFDINMPLLYGERGEKAFIRIQEEILKESSDESIFAWEGPDDKGQNNVAGMLATHRLSFVNGAGITSLSRKNRHNPQGLRAGHTQMKTTILYSDSNAWVYLNCSTAEQPDQKMAVPVIVRENTADGPVISRNGAGITDLASWRNNMPEDVLFLKRGYVVHEQTFQISRVRWDPRQLQLLGAWPCRGWKPASGWSRMNRMELGPRHEMPLETHFNLDLRLGRAIANVAGIISHERVPRGVYPAALAFRCRSTSELNSDEGFILEMEVRPSGDVVRSIFRIPRHLLPARVLRAMFHSSRRLCGGLCPSNFMLGVHESRKKGETALKHWHLELWTKEDTAGRKAAIDTTIRVMTEKDAIAQSAGSRRLRESPLVEVIDRNRKRFLLVTKKAAIIHEASDDCDQESLRGEYWE